MGPGSRSGFVVGAAGAAFIALGAGDAPPPEDRLAAADQLRLAGDYEPALAYYVAAWRDAPDDSAALDGAALAWEALDEEGARDFLTAAMEPGGALPPVAAGVLAAAAGRRGDRARAFNLVRDAPAAGGRATLVRGQLELAAGDLPAAIRDFKEARGAGEPAAAYYAGEALLAAGQYDEAEVYFNEFLRDYPYVAAARCGRGEIYYARGDTARAATEFREALRYEPAQLRARLDLAAIAVAAEDWGKAIRLYGDVLERDPASEPAWRGIAAAYDHVDPAVARAERDEYRRRFGRAP